MLAAALVVIRFYLDAINRLQIWIIPRWIWRFYFVNDIDNLLLPKQNHFFFFEFLFISARLMFLTHWKEFVWNQRFNTEPFNQLPRFSYFWVLFIRIIIIRHSVPIIPLKKNSIRLTWNVNYQYILINKSYEAVEQTLDSVYMNQMWPDWTMF